MAHRAGGTKRCGLSQYAERFAGPGWHVLVIDYCHFGDSGGQLLSPRRQVADIVASARYARSRSDVDQRRVALWGSSFGGGNVLAAAVQDRRVAAVVSQCPLTDGAAGLLRTHRGTGLGQRGLEQAGFDGVQLHAAHGYLIGEFLSPATNLRDDQWGGDLDRRARFLLEVVRAVRRQVDPGFAVMVKINSSDFRPGGFDVDDSAHVVGMLGKEGVDLIEISGGTYESRSGCLGVRADEPGTGKDAYFAGMAPRLRAMTDVPLALTGGLRSRAVMERLIRDGTVDVVGMARPLVQQPEYSGLLLSGAADSIDLVDCPGRGMEELYWWMVQFRRLAAGEDFDPHESLRRVQLEASVGMARQVAATARRKVLDLVAHGR